MIVMGNPLGDLNVISKLVDLGCDISLKDDQDWNCLHWAAFHSNVGAVEVCIEVLL